MVEGHNALAFASNGRRKTSTLGKINLPRRTGDTFGASDDNTMKTRTRLMALIGVSAVAFGAELRADDLQPFPSSQNATISNFQIRHIAGALEGKDAKDSTLLPLNTPTIDVYSVVSSFNLERDSRPPESFSTIVAKIEGRGIPGFASVSLQPQISTSNGAFTNKNIFGDLYSITNGVRAVILGTWNVKAMAATNGVVNLNVTNGHNYDLEVRFTPLNNPPSASNSTTFGPKDVSLSGWFSVSDSDGIVTNVYALSSPGGFAVNGTNWTYSPQGFKGTNTVPFYAVDNMGAASPTNFLTLVTTNNPNLNQAVITNFTVGGGTATLAALVSPGYEHVLLSSTDLSGFGPVATNVIPYLGTNDMTPTSFSLPAASEASFYKLNSR